MVRNRNLACAGNCLLFSYQIVAFIRFHRRLVNRKVLSNRAGTRLACRFTRPCLIHRCALSSPLLSNLDATTENDRYAGGDAPLFLGNFAEITAPTPLSLIIDNVPPCNSTRRLAMVNPNPNPCCSLSLRSNCM